MKVFVVMNVGDIIRTLTNEEGYATAMLLVVRKNGLCVTVMHLEDDKRIPFLVETAGSTYDIDVSKGSQLDRVIWQRLDGDVWIDL